MEEEKVLRVVSERVLLEIESEERDPLPSNRCCGAILIRWAGLEVPEIFIADKQLTNDLSILFWMLIFSEVAGGLVLASLGVVQHSRHRFPPPSLHLIGVGVECISMGLSLPAAGCLVGIGVEH